MLKDHVQSDGQIATVEPVNGTVDTSKPGLIQVPVKVTFDNGYSTQIDVPVDVKPVAPAVPEATGTTITVDQDQPITNDTIKDHIKTDGDIKEVEPEHGPIDTSKPGEQTVPVKVTFENGTTKVVNVPVVVKPVAPAVPEATGTTITVDQDQPITNDTIKDHIKTDGVIKEVEPEHGPIDTSKPGEQTVPVKVTFENGTTKVVNVPVVVNPVAPQPEPEVKPEPQPEPQPEPEVKPEPQPEVKPEPQPEVKPEPQPEVKPEPQPEPQPEVKPEPQSASKPEAQTPNTADVNATSFASILSAFGAAFAAFGITSKKKK